MTNTPETPEKDEPSFWWRLVPMAVFAFGLWLSLYILILIAVLQIIWRAVHDAPNENMATFGDSLSTWAKEAIQFLSYRSEEKPFPWNSWPDSGSNQPAVDAPVVIEEPAAKKPARKTTRKPRAKKTTDKS